MLRKTFTAIFAAYLLCVPLLLLGATGTVTPTTYPGGNLANPVQPISIGSDWVAACTAPTTADNSGSTVVNPGGITRSDQNWVQVAGTGTTLQIRLKYPTAGTVTSPSTAMVIQPYGRDANSIPEALYDGSSTPVHQLTVVVDTTNDARDSTYSYTKPLEIDCNANKEVLVTIKTALAGSSLTGAAILVRVK